MKFSMLVAGMLGVLAVATPSGAQTLSNKLSSNYADIAPSNIFTRDNACGCTPTWSSAAIDSFTIGQRSRLSGVTAALIEINQNDPSYSVAPHFGGFDKTNGYQVNIYSTAAAAAASLTGDVFSATYNPSAVSFSAFAIDPSAWYAKYSEGAALASMSIDMTLDAGTYWLSVISLNDPDIVGQESIYVGLGGTGEAKLANPGGSWAENGFDVPLHNLGGNAGYRVDGVADVPEPATWAMMIVGFGAVGAATRRARATVRFA